MTNTFASWFLLAPAIMLGVGQANAPSEKVQLTIATLHAAALSTSRAAGDSTDAPFFVVEVAAPASRSASILPGGGQTAIGTNGALAARPLTELTLATGDSARVVVSVLEHAGVKPSDGTSVPALLKNGALSIGSVSLLITNEGGAIYWRQFDCVASCRILNAPAATALPAGGAPTASAVAEFSGSGGTYHLALRANRAP